MASTYTNAKHAHQVSPQWEAALHSNARPTAKPTTHPQPTAHHAASSNSQRNSKATRLKPVSSPERALKLLALEGTSPREPAEGTSQETSQGCEPYSRYTTGSSSKENHLPRCAQTPSICMSDWQTLVLTKSGKSMCGRFI